MIFYRYCRFPSFYSFVDVPQAFSFNNDRFKIKGILSNMSDGCILDGLCCKLRYLFLQEGERQSDTPALWWIDGEGEEVKWSFQDVSLNSKK